MPATNDQDVYVAHSVETWSNKIPRQDSALLSKSLFHALTAGIKIHRGKVGQAVRKNGLCAASHLGRTLKDIVRNDAAGIGTQVILFVVGSVAGITPSRPGTGPMTGWKLGCRACCWVILPHPGSRSRLTAARSETWLVVDWRYVDGLAAPSLVGGRPLRLLVKPDAVLGFSRL